MIRGLKVVDVVKVKGGLAGMLVGIDPDTYEPYLTKGNGVSVLCFLDFEVIVCGMMVSSLQSHGM